jgi:hypothetical protein
MRRPVLAWRELHWSRPLDVARPTAAIRAWAADESSPTLVIETRAAVGSVQYLLGSTAPNLTTALRRLAVAIPDMQVTSVDRPRRDVSTAARIKLSTRHRALRLDAAEQIAQQVHAALTAAREDELLVLQLILTARRIPLAIPNHSPSSIVRPWYEVAWSGNGGQVDGEKRAALRDKVGDHGFVATLRIGVQADDAGRRRSLVMGLYSALRVGEAPGVRATMRRDIASRLDDAVIPWLPPLRLNVSEVMALTGWPVGDGELPGLPPLHPKQVASSHLAAKGDRVVADAHAPGVKGKLGLSVTDSMRGMWVIGPNGTGKSTLLLNMICADLEANRPVVVIEPKDLVRDLLERIPATRRDDIAVLDCTDDVPIGINPLQRHGRRPELVADGLLATFQALYGDGLGPRSTDILANCLNVLARHEGGSLVMLPLLLTNPGFRRSLTAPVIATDPIAAGPFWAWFNGLSDDARSQVIAPLSNKLRPLLRPQLRAMLGQRQPRFNVRDVLTKKKVLLVPLQPGVVGPDTAELLGALIVSELWLAIRERAALPEAQRDPVMIALDEVQRFLRLPTDLADALETSRSLRASWTVAHQFRDQLPAAMRAAFEGNIRNRVAFQLNATDARAMAAGQSVIAPDDFTALPAYHVYAQLMNGNSLQPWASGRTLPPPPKSSDPDDIRRRSRQQFGQSLDVVEAEFTRIADSGGITDGPTGRRRRQS